MQTVLWHASAERSGCNDADRSAGSGARTKGVHHGGLRTGDVIRVPRRTIEGVQELGVVCQLSLRFGLFPVELGRAEGAKRIVR